MTSRDLDVLPSSSPDIRPATDARPNTRLRLDEQLCFALYAASNAVIRTYRPLLRAIGLTYPQYILMMALWERDDAVLAATPSVLARRLDLPLNGVTPMLRRLESEGLVERRPDPSDHRTTRITLTEQGRALEADAAHAQQQVVHHIQLPVFVLDQLRNALHRLVRRMTEHETP